MHYNIKSILHSEGFSAKSESRNIYILLFDALKKAIIKHLLKDGIKLPPSRVLAKDLQISRSTVVKAYELLLLEKYIYSVKGSGYYVSSVKHKKNRFSFNTSLNAGKYPKISKRAKSFTKNIQIMKESEGGVAFRPGLPPLDIFPVKLWKNLSNSYWQTVSGSQLSYSNCFGLDHLRQSISEYLAIYRSIQCHPDQIIITTGSLHSLSLISDVLIDKKDTIIIENPTYPHAHFLFKSLKAKIIAAEIDEQGICINKIHCKDPKFIYTTPSNQYPSGVKMSLGRRLELLKWASLNNTLVIEDDYDHEVSNWENPISSVFSLDNENRTIYLGTFNKLLHPSIRVGYMMVPEFMKDSIRALYERSSRFVSPATQTVLSYFIKKDYLNKHLRNIIEVSMERKMFFMEQFENNFKKEIVINSHNMGLHLIGTLGSKINDLDLSKHLRSKGIIAHPYSNYFINDTKLNGLVMGYGSVNKKVIKETIYKMQRAYKSFLNFK